MPHTRVTLNIPELLATYPSYHQHTRVTINIPELPSTYPSYQRHTRVTFKIPELFPYPSCNRTLVTYPSGPHPLKEAIDVALTSEFILFLFFSVLGYLGHATFIVLYEEFVKFVSDNGEDYVNFYGNIIFSSAFIALLVALIIDFSVRKLDQDNAYRQKVISFGILALLCILFSSTRNILMSTMNENYIKASMITFVISTPLKTSQQSVFIRCNFPVQFFGFLNGLTRTLNVFGLLL